jgi:hypothetical protein
MALNFNTQPYYDDFNDNKNFHKILFKPGVSVQARELTQVQSILQDQIGKFGKFVLSDGSKVTGGRYFIDTNVKYLKLANSDTLSTDIQEFQNKYIVGVSSLCYGLITSVDIINNYITVKLLNNSTKNFSSTESLSIFSSKINALLYSSSSSTSDIEPDYTCNLDSNSSFSVSGVYGILNSYEFTINSVAIEVGDVITIPSSNNPYDNYVVTELTGNSVFTVNKPLDEDYNNVEIQITKFASRNIMEVGFDEGVYFTNNHFVKALPLTVIPNIKTQYPNCVIGYEVNETIIDFIDDSSLLDPAQNSYNYTAPGADRYKIYLDLVSKPLVNGEIQNLTTSKFIELLRIKNGLVVKDNTQPTLGELEKVLAKQMYDHAGNFIINDFSLSFHNSSFVDSQTKLKAELSPGKAYVFGHEFEQSYPKFFDIDKGRDTNIIDNYYTSIYYGNHISIQKPSGILLNPQSSARVELHSEAINNANKSTFVAYAYVRNIKYISDNEYYLYLYNISVTENQLAGVKSVVIPTSSSYTSFTFAADAIQTNGKLTTVDPTFNSLLFEFPYKNVASLTNLTLSIDKFTTATVASNNYVLHSGTGKHFSSGTGTLSSDIKKSNFSIVTGATSGAYTTGEYVDLTNVSIVVTQSGSEQLASITFNNGYSGAISIKYALDVTTSSVKSKTKQKNQVSKVYAQKTATSLGIADIANFSGVFYSPYPDSTYIGEWNSSTSYNLYDVVFSGGTLYASNKNSNVNSRPSTENSNWSVLQSVTSNYILNNGQTESIYDHGTITAKTDSDSKQVFVLFDYYTHSSSGEYLCFSSYNDVSYSNIPSLTLQNTNYDLKNFIDFRPRRTNNSTSLIFDNYDIPSTIFSNMQYDFSYYLGRIDKLVLTDSKQFQIIKGIPAYTNQIPPSDIVNAMTIATIQISPFTATQKDVSVKYNKHRRYTMDDIGSLEQRISNVEYYTSLNMVEKDVMSRNIYDNVSGNRMKNGFVVDPFVGYGVMSIADNYKQCSLDLTEQALRPSFDTKYYENQIDLINLPSTLLHKSGIICFNYTETQVTNQILATSTINSNPFDVISYSGNLILSPQSDVWVDTETKPIINSIDSDTSALNEAIATPGLVYDEWNNFYSTTPNTYAVDNTQNTTVVQNNRAIYTVSSAVVKQSSATKILSESIIPFARSIPIQFKATNLAPLTKMFMYVNGKLVNGYVTPYKNVKGNLASISIIAPGTGYFSGNTTVSIVGANTSTATVALEFLGSTISGVEFTNTGSNYTKSGNTIIGVINGAGSNAAVSFSTTQPLAGDLYSDQYGECSGILQLPNDQLLKFVSGELHIVICDNPNYDPTQSISKAEAIFYSSGKTKTTQKTIKSIREPYIKFVGWAPIIPTQDGKIVVNSSREYFVNNYEMDYSIFKTGTIQLPVFLNKKPNSAVSVVASNASGDQSSNTTYSITPSSLTFTDTNYNTTQYFTLTYDLDNKSNVNIYNNLFSYIEYYGTSDDTGFNYSGSKPAELWKTSTSTPGISYTKFNPINKKRPVTIPAAISASAIPVLQETGSTRFIVNISGQKFAEYLPITFSVTSSNTSVGIIDGIYKSTDKSTLIKSNQVVINSLDEMDYFTVVANYANSGNANAVFTVTSTSADTYWNNIQTTTTLTHIVTPVPPAAPEIIIKPSTGSDNYTTEDGKTTTINLILSSQPNTNVAIYATSMDTTEGLVTRVSDNATTFVSGNTINFTPSDWDKVKVIEVTGQPDSIIDGEVFYNINLRSSSANGYWNNLQANVSLKNLDTTVIPPVIPGFIYYSYLNGIKETSESGNTVTLQVNLNKIPTSNVYVLAVSSNPSEGKITSESNLIFTPTNWNTPQNIVITGQPDSVVDGTANYVVNLSSVTSDKNFSSISNTAPIANIDTTVPYRAPGSLTITKTGNQTSENGSSVTFTTKLDSAPLYSVTVNYTSSNLSEGRVTSGSYLTFTPTNWSTPQTTIVTGQDDGSYTDGADLYTVNITTASTDVVYNALTYSYDLVNLSKAAPPAGQIIATSSGSLGENITNESGNYVSISVRLSRAPLTDIYVSAVSSNLSEGIVFGSPLTFTPSNWNIAQLVKVVGQPDGLVDGSVQYSITFTASTTSLDPNGFTGTTVNLVNQNIDAPITFTTKKTISISEKRYEVLCSFTPDNWLPSVTFNGPGDTTTTGIIGYGAIRQAPTSFVNWVNDPSKDGSFTVIVSAFLAGITGQDQKPDGWARARVKLYANPGTHIGHHVNFTGQEPRTYWREAAQIGWANSAGAPPGENFFLEFQDNAYLQFRTLILESDSYTNAYSTWAMFGQAGQCRTTWDLKGACPDFRHPGVTIHEHYTITVKTDIINDKTGKIESTSTSSTPIWGAIWQVWYGNCAMLGQTADRNDGSVGIVGELNQAAYDALYKFVMSFPSISGNSWNKAAFDGWFKDTIPVTPPYSGTTLVSGNESVVANIPWTKSSLKSQIEKQQLLVQGLKNIYGVTDDSLVGGAQLRYNKYFRELHTLQYLTNLYNDWDK